MEATAIICIICGILMLWDGSKDGYYLIIAGIVILLFFGNEDGGNNDSDISSGSGGSGSKPREYSPNENPAGARGRPDY